MIEVPVVQTPRYMKYRSSLHASATTSSGSAANGVGGRSDGDGAVDQMKETTTKSFQMTSEQEQLQTSMNHTNRTTDSTLIKSIGSDSKFSKFRNASMLQKPRPSTGFSSTSNGNNGTAGLGSGGTGDSPNARRPAEVLSSSRNNSTSMLNSNNNSSNSLSTHEDSQVKPHQTQTKIPRYAQYRTALSQSGGGRSQSLQVRSSQEVPPEAEEKSATDPGRKSMPQLGTTINGVERSHNENDVGSANKKSSRYLAYKSHLTGSNIDNNKATSPRNKSTLIVEDESLHDLYFDEIDVSKVQEGQSFNLDEAAAISGVGIEVVVAQSSKDNNSSNIPMPIVNPTRMSETYSSTRKNDNIQTSTTNSVLGNSNDNHNNLQNANDNIEVRLNDDKVIVEDVCANQRNLENTTSSPGPKAAPKPSYAPPPKLIALQGSTAEPTKNRNVATGSAALVATGGAVALMSTTESSSASSIPASSTTATVSQGQSQQGVASSAVTSPPPLSSMSYLQRVEDFLRLQTDNVVTVGDTRASLSASVVAPEAETKLVKSVSFSDTTDDDVSEDFSEDTANNARNHSYGKSLKTESPIRAQSTPINIPKPDPPLEIASVLNPIEDVRKLMVGSKARFAEILELDNLTPLGIKSVNYFIQLWDELERDSKFLKESWKNMPRNGAKNQISSNIYHEHQSNGNIKSNLSNAAPNRPVVRDQAYGNGQAMNNQSGKTKEHHQRTNKHYSSDGKHDTLLGSQQDLDIEEGSGMLVFRPSISTCSGGIDRRNTIRVSNTDVHNSGNIRESTISEEQLDKRLLTFRIMSFGLVVLLIVVGVVLLIVFIVVK